MKTRTDRLNKLVPSICLAFIVGLSANVAVAADGPSTLFKKGRPVEWWFEFKLNGAMFAGCGGDATQVCPFGGDVQGYKAGQQYVYASSDDPNLQKGSDCAGDTVADPIGATFDEIYN